VITDQESKVKALPPKASKVVVVKSPSVIRKAAKYDPNLIKQPKFREVVQTYPPVLLEFEDPRDVSFSPFDESFPRPSHEKRKSRNRSNRHRRHLLAAMEQYKSEHGPMNERSVHVEKDETKQMKSYSPWQEEQFARACGIPFTKYMKAKNIPALRPFSFSPWSDKFPVFKAASKQVTLPKGALAMPSAPTATPFPAFSPLHKRVKATPRTSVTPSTSAMDLVEEYEMLAGLN